MRNKQGRKIKYRINRRPPQLRKLSLSGQYAARKAEHRKSSVRAKVEHDFVWSRSYFDTEISDTMVCEQTAKLNILFAPADLILADRLGLSA